MLIAGVSALALGIGLTTVMFSIIYGLLIKGLPFAEPQRIAMIYRADPKGNGEEDLVPFADFVQYSAQQTSFAAFGGYYTGTVSMSGGKEPERVHMARTTAGALDVTGVRPMLGRIFTGADNAPGAEPTAVLGYPLWRDTFGRDSAVVGHTVRVDGQAYTVIGVMPEGFQFPQSQKLWLPLQVDPAPAFTAVQGPLTIVARLKPNVTLARANAELATLSRSLTQEHSDSAAMRDLAQPFVRAVVPTRVYSLLYGMLGAVFLVLLVACANVANLLLDRAANRTREVGIRIALGASRAAVIRQSLVESAIMAVLAAVAGTGLAQAGIAAFNRALLQTQADRPFWTDVRLHLPVLLFALGAATLASLISGVLPALHSARLDINTILKDESHTASSLRVGRLSRAIVIGEIALSAALVLAAGFMTKSILRLRDMDPRFETSGIITARISLTGTDLVRQRRFFETLEQNLGAISGAGGAYVGDELPGAQWSGRPITLEGKQYARPQDHPVVRTLAVSAGFFRTFGVRMLQGRMILPTDGPQAPGVAVVSESFVRRHFSEGSPLGRRIRLGDGRSEDGSDGAWVTVVGVMPTLFAATVRAGGNHFPAEVLTSVWQAQRLEAAAVAVRGSAGIANAATLRKSVASLDPDVPIYDVTSMHDALWQPQWPVRVFGTLFMAFGAASLVLAVIGLYAVMAFAVTRRVREIGIRVALGATNGNVIRMICRQGAMQIVLGMSMGLGVGMLLVQGLRMVLFEVQPNDVSVFAVVASVLGLAAFVACLIPAIGATRVDPAVALRRE